MTANRTAARSGTLSPGTADAAVTRPLPRTSGPSRITTIAVLVVTGALILAAAYVTNRSTIDAGGLQTVNLSGTPQGPAPVIGQTAPPLVAQAADGSAFSLANLKGSFIWLTFGASWCQPCRAENADIQATYDAFKARGVIVVQVFMDEDATAVNDYAARVGLTYQKVPDPKGQFATNYRILGIPTHFFIDRDGVLRQIKVGTLQASDMAQVLTDLGAGG